MFLSIATPIIAILVLTVPQTLRKYKRKDLCKTCENREAIGNYAPCYFCKRGDHYNKGTTQEEEITALKEM